MYRKICRMTNTHTHTHTNAYAQGPNKDAHKYIQGHKSIFVSRHTPLFSSSRCPATAATSHHHLQQQHLKSYRHHHHQHRHRHHQRKNQHQQNVTAVVEVGMRQQHGEGILRGTFPIIIIFISLRHAWRPCWGSRKRASSSRSNSSRKGTASSNHASCSSCFFVAMDVLPLRPRCLSLIGAATQEI